MNTFIGMLSNNNSILRCRGCKVDGRVINIPITPSAASMISPSMLTDEAWAPGVMARSDGDVMSTLLEAAA